MSIVRMFQMDEDDRTGEVALRPLFIEGADPANGAGCAHDILEHMVDTEGGAEGECMALGAMFWGRGEAGMLNRGFTRRPDYELFAGDVMFILENIYNERNNETMRSPGRTLKLRDYDRVEETFTRGARQGWEDFVNSMEPYGSFLDNKEEYIESMIGWARKGFRRAEAIYYGRYRRDASDIAYLYDRLADKISKKMQSMSEHHRLKVSIDLHRNDFRLAHLVEMDFRKWVEV